jgi:hypothetical protein
MVTKKGKIAIYIPEKLREALIKLAADDRRSLSVYVELLILEALAARGIILSLEDNEDE